MMAIFFGSTYIPSLDMEWPSDIPSFIKNSHFLVLTERFISMHLFKTLNNLERDTWKPHP